MNIYKIVGNCISSFVSFNLIKISYTYSIILSFYFYDDDDDDD